jgi:hypothetical protein
MSATKDAEAMFLLVISLFGLIVPNGLFLYALARDYGSLSEALSNRLALALLIDAFLATGLLAWIFRLRPIGPVKWPWFVVLSLVGGLGFSIPFYLWLNWRRQPAGTSFRAWFRDV